MRCENLLGEEFDPLRRIGAMNRRDALALMHAHVASESLRRHMLGVEACMKAYARALGEDEEAWGVVGLLHDFDYELHPNDHPLWGVRLLKERQADPVLIQAIASHYEAKTGIAPTTPMEKHLFACDELSGFITACVYVRPSRSILDLESKSVIKKLKTPSFAAGVSREDVAKGAELIGKPLADHIDFCIGALKGEASVLGLIGEG
jgi:putative nucleotidyltransferase with HDIG domain